MLKVSVRVDGPVGVDFMIDREQLARDMAAEAPVGKHDHDPPGWITRRGKEPRAGAQRLKRWLGHMANWHLTKKGRGAWINVFLAYALIQDQGGPVRPVYTQYTAKFGKRGGKYKRAVMVWRQGGGTVFATARKGFTIPAKNYVQRGVDRFTASGTGFTVKWQDGPTTTRTGGTP